MNKLNVGDYVRYEYENIIYLGKIDFISEVMCGLDETLEIAVDNCVEPILKKDIIKSSPNIIDLIEENDLIKYRIHGDLYVSEVKGHPEFDKYKLHIEYLDTIIDLNDLSIVSIITHEQFENISYKVGE